MIFSNYGLFWRADRVNWGSPGNKGTLSGYRTDKDGEVDFRNQRGVYVLYDESYELLYAGQAGYGNQRLYDRLRAHRFDHLGERWTRFSWFGIDRVKGRSGKKVLVEEEPKAPDVAGVLNHMEGILIASAEPRLNKQSGRFGDAEAYYQWYYEEDDPEKRLERIEKMLKKLIDRIDPE